MSTAKEKLDDIARIDLIEATANSALQTKSDVEALAIDASSLTEDSTHRLVTDTEKSNWNGKLDASHDMTLTLDGDVSGSATFTNMGNATLTATIADDSHNHTIANVDGLQTALAGKLSTTGTASNSDKLDGIHASQFIRNDTSTTQTIGSNIKVGFNEGSGNEGGQIDFAPAPTSGLGSPFIDVYGATAGEQYFRFVQRNSSNSTVVAQLPAENGTIWTSARTLKKTVNSNGTCIELLDGFKIQSQIFYISSQAWGAGGVYTNVVTWTFPVAFSSTGTILHRNVDFKSGYSYDFQVGSEGLSTTQMLAVHVKNIGTSTRTTDMTIYVTAMGY